MLGTGAVAKEKGVIVIEHERKEDDHDRRDDTRASS
jgi:hypothetical protein